MGIDDSWSTAVNLTRRELMEQFALYADGKVNMHDRANMYPTSEDNDMIWGECVEIGIGATTRTVIAGDNCSQNSSLGIWMRGGHIAGHAATRGEVDAEDNAQIDYPMNDFRIVEMPDLNVVTSETVGFPSSIVGQQWINVNPNDPPWPVDPNTHYGNVTLNSNAEMVINECGNYYFNSLTVNSGARIRILDTDCETSIFTKEYLIWRGTLVTDSADPIDPSRLLWGVMSSFDTLIEETLRGTILAPRSTVRIACAKNLIGAVFAKNIEVFQDARIIARKPALTNIYVPEWEEVLALEGGDDDVEVRPNTGGDLHHCQPNGIRVLITYLKYNAYGLPYYEVFDGLVDHDDFDQTRACESAEINRGWLAGFYDRCSMMDIRLPTHLGVADIVIEIERAGDSFGNVTQRGFYRWTGGSWVGGTNGPPDTYFAAVIQTSGVNVPQVGWGTNDVYAGNTWINPSNWFSDYPAFYAGIGWNRRESNEDFPQNDRLFAFRWECCDWCGPETPPDMVDTMIFRIRQN